MKEISQSTRKILLEAQKNEITEYHIYIKLAAKLARSKKQHKRENAEVLERIGKEELRHYEIWKKYTGEEVKPKKMVIFFFFWIARIFGITFGIKLMEKGEEIGQQKYDEMSKEVPEAKKIAHDEDVHEQSLIAILKEERLEYVGSIVLGLNDALVELTGALAGLTFALQNSKLIAIAGGITGIAASFSMAASEYLSNKAEGNTARALKSAIYTGIAYIITVGLLILPYLLIPNLYICLAITLSTAVLIIFLFNYYISVAKDLKFTSRFLEMTFLSLGVAAISFGIAVLIRSIWGVDI